MLHYLTSLTDIYVMCLIHMQRERTLVNGRSTACHGLNLILDLNQKVLKSLVFLSNSSFYLSVFVFKTSVNVFFILFNCSISMNFLCLWKTLFQLLKCLHALIALGFFISFLWLSNLMRKEVSDFPTYCILQSRHSNK